MTNPVSDGATVSPVSYLKLVVSTSRVSTSRTAERSKARAKDKRVASSARPVATRAYVDRDESGAFVYRLVDVTTGRTLAELPRTSSDWLKMLDDDASAALAASV